VDANGVDLFLGTLNIASPQISMGQGEAGLAFRYINNGGGWTDTAEAALNQGSNSVTVTLGGVSDDFSVSGTSYTSVQQHGATLTVSGSVYTYTSADGTVVHFDKAKSAGAPYYASLGRADDIIRPSGEREAYSYTDLRYCANFSFSTGRCTQFGTAYRLSSVTNSYGYRLTLAYAEETEQVIDDYNRFVDPTRGWNTVVGMTLSNLEQPAASGVSLQSQTDSSGVVSITDPMNRTTRYRMSGVQVAGITQPGSTSESLTATYTNGRVSSVATAAGTWNYAFSDDANGGRTVTVTDPASQSTRYVFEISSQLMKSMTDALGHTTSWTYTPDGTGHVRTATAQEGNSVEYG